MFARKRVDARGRVRRELRIEVGEDVELRVERVRDRHVVLVAAGPVERLRARHALQVVDVDLACGEHRELLVPEVVADDAHHRDVGEEARREREVGRRSAEHPFALSERGLERVEGDGSDDGDGHAVADTTVYGGAADLALRRDRPLLGRVQHRRPGDRVLPALRRARPARAGRRVRHGPLAHPVAEGRSRCRGRGRLGGHARARAASGASARACPRSSTRSRCTSWTCRAATGRSWFAAGSASGPTARTTSRRWSASTRTSSLAARSSSTTRCRTRARVCGRSGQPRAAPTCRKSRDRRAVAVPARMAPSTSSRSRCLAFDPLAQSGTLEMQARMWRDGELVAEETHPIDLMFYFKDELVLMLERAGFREVEVRGGYDGADADAGARVPRLQREEVAAATTCVEVRASADRDPGEIGQSGALIRSPLSWAARRARSRSSRASPRRSRALGRMPVAAATASRTWVNHASMAGNCTSESSRLRRSFLRVRAGGSLPACASSRSRRGRRMPHALT